MLFSVVRRAVEAPKCLPTCLPTCPPALRQACPSVHACVYECFSLFFHVDESTDPLLEVDSVLQCPMKEQERYDANNVGVGEDTGSGYNANIFN